MNKFLLSLAATSLILTGCGGDDSDDNAPIIGEVTFKYSCVLAEQLTSFSLEAHDYSGDLLKLDCNFKIENNTKIDRQKFDALADANRGEMDQAQFDVFKAEFELEINEDLKGHIENDNSSIIYQKGVGVIAEVDNDCVNEETEEIDDQPGCTANQYQYSLLRQ
jgi:hypothetical protein